ncbi:MAG TPA: peptide chain release factor N(5)-glutamine methyltransferase [Bauldia sp.]
MREAAVTATTVAALRREIAGMLAATSPTAALDARLVVAHVLGWAPNDVLLRDSDRINDAAVLTAEALARRRAGGEPVARVVGEKEFYGLVFDLSPETLVPRPDTETVVDAVLAAVAADTPAAILDLGTGSGAILVALLTQLPRATGVGVDVSPGALATARRNAEKLGVAPRAVFVAGDWGRGIDRHFDVVVANPPYVASGSIAGLPVEVRDHDPHVALDGGADGLAAIRAILADLDRLLAADGVAFVEIGFDQAPEVRRLAGEHGFACAFQRDLGSIDRVAILRRQSFPPSGPGKAVG